MRDAIGGIPFGASIGGRSGLYKAAKVAWLTSEKQFKFADDLFPLRCPEFETDLGRTVTWTKGSLDFAITTLMEQTANSGEDIRTPGTQAFIAAQAYLDGIKTVRIP